MPNLGIQIGVAVVANGDEIDIADARPGHAQNFDERASRKASQMLVAQAKPFLGYRAHELAILDRTGGGIGMKGVQAKNQVHEKMRAEIRQK
jgi:hypothetical protein